MQIDKDEYRKVVGATIPRAGAMEKPSIVDKKLFCAARNALVDLAEGYGTFPASCAYGQAINAMELHEFATDHGVTIVTGYGCMRKLWGGRHRKSGTCGGHDFPVEGTTGVLWAREGVVVVCTAEMPALSLSSINQISAYCKKWDLDAVVNTWPCPSFPGGNVSIHLWKAGTDWRSPELEDK